MKMKSISALSLSAFILSSSFISSAHAAEIPLLNHNFDSDVIPIDPGYTNRISGWVKSGQGGIGVTSPLGGGVNYNSVGARGQVAYLASGGRFYQASKTTLEDGETYTVNFDVGQDLEQTIQHFVVRFKADGLVLAQKHIESFDVTPVNGVQVHFPLSPTRICQSENH